MAISNSASEATEIKSLDGYLETKGIDEGIIEGVIAVYGNVDSQPNRAKGTRGDRLMPGSFARTIGRTPVGMPIAIDHEALPDGDVFPSGVTESWKELSRDELPADVLARAPDAMGGVWARGRFALNGRTRHAIREIKSRGGMVPLSFRFKTIRDAVVGNVREVYEVAVAEWGPQISRPPANEAAFGTVKSEDGGLNILDNPAPYVPANSDDKSPAQDSNTASASSSSADSGNTAPANGPADDWKAQVIALQADIDTFANKLEAINGQDTRSGVG